ncbi:MAG: hypothetical protein ACXVAX_00255 [Pseudobdellovibrio sp.]
MMTKEFNGLKKNKGQIAIESVLLITVLMAGFLVLTSAFRQKQYLSKMVEGPMKNLAAMTAYGTWHNDGCTAAGKSKVSIGKCHPNSIERSQSSDPKPL